MLRVSCVVTVLFACAHIAPELPPEFQAQRDLISKIQTDFPETRYVGVEWAKCEDAYNSYLYPDRILLCYQMREFPVISLFFAAHEAAHAVTREYLGTVSESDADEIAALEMIKHGYVQGLLQTSVYWLADPENLKHVAKEEHPGHEYRAWLLACLAAGASKGPKQCVELYNSTKLKWENRLSDKDLFKIFRK